MDYQNTNDQSFIYSGKLATRMACHLGDLSKGSPASALCNIIGDQPLFYIDYIDEEEADFIDPQMLPEMFDDLFNEDEATYIPTQLMDPATLPADLRRRLSRLEAASAHIETYKKTETQDAFDAAFGQINQPSAQTPLKDFITAIENSRFLGNLYQDITNAGVNFKTSSQFDKAAYDRDGKTIYINPHLNAQDGAIAASSAMRQAWLQLKGAAIHPLHFAPEEAILLNRIQTADLACTTLRAAWELKLAGFDAPWARIITGSGYDLAQSFAREAIADFRALQTGDATNTAFEKWFFSGRCKEVDRKLIQSMLSDNHGLVFNHPEVSRMVTADIIARTGDMPQAKNYLTGLVEVILADPLFTELRDRSNANFLWFIKFERSFRVAEDTQDQAQQPAHNMDGAASSQNPAQNTAQSMAGSVVNFPVSNRITAKKRGKTSAKTANKTADDMATVYYLDHFLSFSNR